MSEVVSMLYPIRRGSRLFVKINGNEIELEPLQAAILAQEWTHEVTAAYVYSKLNDRHDTQDMSMSNEKPAYTSPFDRLMK